MPILRWHSWHNGSDEMVLLYHQGISLLRVSNDIDGRSFRVTLGAEVDEDTIAALDHDMDLRDGSEFVPVKPLYFNVWSQP